MKVKCIKNTGLGLSEESIEAGNSRNTKFDLQVDEIYIVYSMLMFKQSIEYLISKGPKKKPFWYPAELFEVVDNLLPIEWYFSFRGYDKKDATRLDFLSAIWGYEEMALNKNHYADLIEREPEALDIFFKKQEEIDEYEELSKFRKI